MGKLRISDVGTPSNWRSSITDCEQAGLHNAIRTRIIKRGSAFQQKAILMSDTDGIIHTFQLRRQLENELEALASTTSQAALQQAVHGLAERFPTNLLLAAVLRHLGTSNSQLRGGLGRLCTLLPSTEVLDALRSVAANRQKTPQERTAAALILQRFLDQPAPSALLADLAGADEAPYQSLLEAVAEGKQNRHVLLEYVMQMQEHSVDVAFMVLRLIDRLSPEDGVELLRLIAYDNRPQVAHAAIDRLAATAASGVEASLRALHTLVYSLPPNEAALAQRSLRKLQFSGTRYTLPAADNWQSFLGPSDPSGYASIWFVRWPSPRETDADGVWLGFVLSLQSGILQFSGSEGMQRDFLPPPTGAGELVAVRTSGGQNAVLLAAPVDVGRWLVRQALEAHWGQAAPQPLPDEFALYNDLLWQFAPPQLPPDLATWWEKAGAAVDAPPPAASVAAAADVLVTEAAMDGWLRWGIATWQNVKYRSQQPPEVPSRTLVNLLLRELARMPDHRSLLQAMTAGLRLQTVWYAVAGDTANAERAALLAQATTALPISENPLIANLLERGLNRQAQ
jgi:hypothetical protein